MSDCLGFPEFPIIPLPSGLSVPSLPNLLSIGGGDFCCIAKYPGFNPKLPIEIPSSLSISLAAVTNAQLTLLEAYYAAKDCIPTCPLD